MGGCGVGRVFRRVLEAVALCVGLGDIVRRPTGCGWHATPRLSTAAPS
jgi:hypothetical protein